MPAESEAQRRMMGAALAAKRGEGSDHPKSSKVASEMSEQQLRDFAKKSLAKSVINLMDKMTRGTGLNREKSHLYSAQGSSKPISVPKPPKTTWPTEPPKPWVQSTEPATKAVIKEIDDYIEKYNQNKPIGGKNKPKEDETSTPTFG